MSEAADAAGPGGMLAVGGDRDAGAGARRAQRARARERELARAVRAQRPGGRARAGALARRAAAACGSKRLAVAGAFHSPDDGARRGAVSPSTSPGSSSASPSAPVISGASASPFESDPRAPAGCGSLTNPVRWAETHAPPARARRPPLPRRRARPGAGEARSPDSRRGRGRDPPERRPSVSSVVELPGTESRRAARRAPSGRNRRDRERPARPGRPQRRDRRAARRRRRLDRPAHRDPRAPLTRPRATPSPSSRPRPASAALERAGIEPADVDLILVATSTPDERVPNAAPLVAERIGAANAGAIDIGAACTGFVSALELAAAATESGRADVTLVIGAELMSRVLDLRRPAHGRPLRRRRRARRSSSPAAEARIGPIRLRADGAGSRAVTASHEENLVRMDGRATFRAAVARLSEVTLEVAETAGVELDRDRPVRLPPGQQPDPLARSATGSGSSPSAWSTRSPATATPPPRASRSRSTRRSPRAGCDRGAAGARRRLRRRAHLGRRDRRVGDGLTAMATEVEEAVREAGAEQAGARSRDGLRPGHRRLARDRRGDRGRARRRGLAGGGQLPRRPRGRRGDRRRARERRAARALAIQADVSEAEAAERAARDGRGRARAGAGPGQQRRADRRRALDAPQRRGLGPGPRDQPERRLPAHPPGAAADDARRASAA